ncbi:MAG: hypothetical protein KC458_01605 [Dehalococcoidia bacterium]|nr:hypothetical protein [Dehalococcoidia bacterium]
MYKDAMVASTEERAVTKKRQGELPEVVGRQAERVVDEWADRAGIGIEVLSPDNHGIDRWFELRPDPLLPPGVGLDALPKDIHGYIQVKGTQHPENPCPISLSNLRRAVNLDHPFFYLGIVLDEALGVSRAHLVHVDEQLVGRVLEALRKLDEEDLKSLHKKTLSLSWTEANALASASPAALVGRIYDLVERPETYAKRKRRWRERVGYGERPIRLQVKVHGTREQIAMAFVGEGRLEADVLEHSDVRFGIHRPVRNGIPLGRALLSFGEVENAPRAEVRAWNDDAAPTVIRGRLRFSPTSHPQVMRFSSPSLQVDLRDHPKDDEKSMLDLRHLGLLDLDAPLPLRALADASALLWSLLRPGGEGELRCLGETIDLRPALEPRPRKILRDMAPFEWAFAVAREAGIDESAEVRPRSILSQARAFCAWGAYLGRAQEPVKLAFPTTAYRGGPACATMLALAELAGHYVVQALAFRDETPEPSEEGLTMRALPHAKSRARLLRPDEASQFDPIAEMADFEKGLDDSNQFLLIQSTSSITEEWDAGPKRAALRQPSEKSHFR